MDISQTNYGSPDLSQEILTCIQKCTLCHQIVVQTLNYCISKGGEHVEPDHLRSMLDCAQITSVAADFLSRNSEMHVFTCRACTEVCLACALSCEDFGHSNEVMEACAEACHRCAESCQKMVMEHH